MIKIIRELRLCLAEDCSDSEDVMLTERKLGQNLIITVTTSNDYFCTAHVNCI